MPIVTIGLFPSIPFNSILLTREFWITIAVITIIPLAFMRVNFFLLKEKKKLNKTFNIYHFIYLI